MERRYWFDGARLWFLFWPVLMASAGLAETVFETTVVVDAPGDQSSPAIWGNYIVWAGAQGQAYDIAARQLVEMPGLNIEGPPAIWEDKVVWPGATGYYDLRAKAFVEVPGLSVGNNPAIHNDRIVWDKSGGYYDLALRHMVYPPGLAVGSDPDIFEDKIVWSQSTGYYHIGRQAMVYPEGMAVGSSPAIHDDKVIWTYWSSYYDIVTQSYAGPPFSGPVVYRPDIFGQRFVYTNIPSGVAGTTPASYVSIRDPFCGYTRLSESGAARAPAIYADIVVWSEGKGVGDRDIYMAQIFGCCGDPEHPYPVGDLNQDCRVDLADLAILLSHWLECTGPACD